MQPNRPGEVYREGVAIGGFELESIQPRGILLRGDHGECWLNIMGARMLKPPPRVSIRGTRTARAQHSPQAAFSKAELERAIHPTGPHAYDVERSLLKAAVARAGQLARTTRLAPVRHFSAVSGMQINALAESGLLAHLGLMRGDLVKSLNGVPLTGLVDMLRAQTLLTSTPRLSLLIMRQGVPFALDYHLVD